VSQEVTFVRNVIVKGFIKSSVKKEVGNWYNVVWLSSLREWLDTLAPSELPTSTNVDEKTNAAAATALADVPTAEPKAVAFAPVPAASPPLPSSADASSSVVSWTTVAMQIACLLGMLYLAYTVHSLQLSVERLTLLLLDKQ
jgi:hypothetical protein